VSDFVTILTEDHRRVEQLFNQFEQTGDAGVANQIFLELSAHTMVEEELIYGLYSSKVDSAGAAEARQEHQEAKDLIVQLEGMEPGTDEFSATMTQLKEAVMHHVEEEENEMFPTMLKALPDTAGVLGNDIAVRKEAVLQQMGADRLRGMAPSTTNQKPTASPEPGW
jgi:hemerythrin-like domain-containing protein